MQVVIIGNGIAGITAARHIRKRSNCEITVISAESSYFFSRTALMYVYMGHMKFEHTQPYEDNFWAKNRINLLHNKVADIQSDHKKLLLQNGEEINYDKLIIATGSKPNFFGWKGQDLIGVQGLYSKQDLELMEQNTKGIKQAIVSGGGLIGIEMAEMLLSRGIEVHFLIREKYFWGSVLPREESVLIMNHLKKHHGLVMHYEEEIGEIQGDFGNRVEAVITKKGTRIEGQFLGVTVGVSPNTDFMKSTGIEMNRGILVNELLETSLPDCYAIGDCAEMRNPRHGRRALEQVWYTGRMMGETVAKTLTGLPTEYNPGHWFNSAKFFDIEYQTYGLVPAKISDKHEEFVWQHPSEELLLHFVFDKETHRFEGINTFGIRLRHELFDTWLNEMKSIEFVLENLASANFDPEFYSVHEPAVVIAFNQQFNSQLKVQKKQWWRNLLTH